MVADLSISKVGVFVDRNADGFAEAGEVVRYIFTIFNTGDTPVSNITISDPLLAAPIVLPGPLTVGGLPLRTSFDYRLTDADIDAGVVINTAIVTGEGADGSSFSANVGPTETGYNIEAGLALEVDASQILDANGNGVVGDAGDTLVYEYTIRNNSPRTAFNLTLTESKAVPSQLTIVGLVDLDGMDGTGQPGPNDLPIGGEATATFNYTITQAEFDARQVRNSVRVFGITRNDETIEGELDRVVNLTRQMPAIALQKFAGVIQDTDGDGFDSVGDQVTYTYFVSNTGELPLNNLKLIDDNGTQLDPSDDVTLTLQDLGGQVITSLNPGEQAFASYTGVLTQAAIDDRRLYNVATVTGTSPLEETVEAQDDAEVQPKLAGISLLKTASAIVDTDGNGFDSVGDAITYTYVVENTGEVLLANLDLVDDNGTPGEANDADNVTISLVDADGNSITQLAPGAQAFGTYTGALTQAAIDAGTLSNVAVVKGTAPKGGIVEAEDDATVTPSQKSTIKLEKQADPIAGLRVGDSVIYSYVTTNTGNTALLNVVVLDDDGTPADPSDDFIVTLTTGLTDIDGDGEIDDLAVGGSASGTATKILTAEDVAADSLTNIAEVTAVDRNGNPVFDTSDATVKFVKDPKIELHKMAKVDLGHDHHLNAHDTITYTFTIKNVGDVAIDQIALVDPLFPRDAQAAFAEAVQAAFDNWLQNTDDNATFERNESFTVDFDYTITNDDIHNHGVTNTATVYGNPVGGRENDRTDDAVASAGAEVSFNGNDWQVKSFKIDRADDTSETADPNDTGSSTIDEATASLQDSAEALVGFRTNFLRQGNTFIGSSADEMMMADDETASYTMFGNGGRDVMWSHDGDDMMYGGNAFDFIFAGGGDNTVFANGGEVNVVIAGNGNNTIYGGAELDVLITGAGDDTIYAQDGLNAVFSGGGTNTVYLGSGIDYVGLSADGATSIYNFNAQQDTFVLVGLGADDVVVDNSGQFTAIKTGDRTIATLIGAKANGNIDFVSTNDAGLVSSLSVYIPDAFRTDTVRDALLGAGVPSALANQALNV